MSNVIPLPGEVGHAGDGDVVTAMLRNLREEVVRLTKANAELERRNEQLETSNEYLSRQLREALR